MYLFNDIIGLLGGSMRHSAWIGVPSSCAKFIEMFLKFASDVESRSLAVLDNRLTKRCLVGAGIHGR